MSRLDRDWSMLRLERAHDLLWVTLDNAEKANALSPALLREITELYSLDLRAEGIRALILRGDGKHFSAGADLGHLESLKTAGPEENRRDSEALRDLFSSILHQEALTVACVHGACVAGGCGVATAHDYVIAGEDARFMYSEVRIGFVAALVATFLPLRVKGADLRELLLDPQFIDAHEAKRIGLANRVVAKGELLSAAEELVSGLLERASSESIARTKRLLLDAVGRPLREALDLAADVNARSRATDDCRRGISTFLETKKTPVWRS